MSDENEHEADELIERAEALNKELMEEYDGDIVNVHTVLATAIGLGCVAAGVGPDAVEEAFANIAASYRRNFFPLAKEEAGDVSG